MSIRGITLALVASVAPVSFAQAADVFAPMESNNWYWSGFYAGVVGSGGFFRNEMSDQWCATACDAPDMSGWGGGIGLTAGWNMQHGSAVFGVEGDVSWMGFENSLDVGVPPYLEHNASWDWLATLRARAGLTSGRVLAYVTGGLAVAQTDYSSWYLPPTEAGFRTNQTQLGLAVGAGVEVAMNERLSLKGEYLYVGMPDVRTSYQNGGLNPSEYIMTYRSDAHLVRLGLNYNFHGARQGDMASAWSMGGGEHDWSGFYAGVVGTAGMFTNEMSDLWCFAACDAPDMAGWGGGIGLAAGWNMQHGAAVFGIEGDLSWVGFENGLDITDNISYRMEHRASWDWLATLRARAGLTTGNVMGYVTGGIAIADTNYSSWYVPPFNDEGFRTSQTQVGLAVGAGVEVAMNERLSLKGEYLYVGMPNVTTNYQRVGRVSPDSVMTYRSDAHLVRLGLNYRFNDGGSGGSHAMAGPMVDWSGFHAGVVGSGAMFTNEMSDQWGDVGYDAPDMSGWGGGIGLAAGWNTRHGPAVFGIEGDVSWVGFENGLDVGVPTYLQHRASWDWLATLRGRAGLATGNVLGYVTGGLAVANTEYSSTFIPNVGVDDFSASQTQLGLAVGAGVEVAMSERLSVKGEYLYVGMPDVTTRYQTPAGPGPIDALMTYRSDAHMFRLGLNYRFRPR